MSTYTATAAVYNAPQVEFTLHFDIETRSTVDLKRSGADKYSKHPDTRPLCMCYAVGDTGRIGLWLPGQPPPAIFVTAAADPQWVLSGHNVAFDRAIYENILVPRHGFPAIPREQFRCTAAIARSIGLPGALHGVAGALDLPEECQKDTEGGRVMLRLAKPRKPRIGEDPAGIFFEESPLLKERLFQYCRTDVNSEREAHKQLRHHRLSEFEQRLWHLDQRINDYGFCTDLELAQSCKAVAELVAQEVDAELARITGGVVTSVGQVARTLGWLGAAGVVLSNLNKLTVEQTLLRDDLPEPARQVLQLRQNGAGAAAKKAQSFIDRTDFDGRLRGSMIYCGAHTGRWSSLGGVQIHNLKRFEADNIPELIEAVHSRDLGRIKALHSRPLELLGNLNRSMIVAAPGKRLLGADLSSIESRCLAWEAGETWKVEAHRAADQPGGTEVYVLLGSRMTGTPVAAVTGKKHPVRALGKVADLSCGYQGWEKAVERFAPGVYTEDERKNIAGQWRDQHPRTVAFWRQLQASMWDAVATNSNVECGPVTFEMKGSGMWLRVRLPSGRRLYYPHPTNSLADPTKPSIEYKVWVGNDWFPEQTYGGKLAENITQAIARDVLAECLLRIDAAGFKLLMHVHDEVVVEIDDGEDREQELLQIMRQSPAWAPDLPVNAAAWSGLRFQ